MKLHPFLGKGRGALADQVISIDKDRYLIDGFDLGVAERTGTFVLDEGQLTLIETGPSISVPYIKRGLKSLGYSLEQVRYIIVTHIHLDHSGGLGLLLNDCPNATVYAHDKGIRHLIDPTRLIKGAKVVYGSSFDSLFSPVLPVDENRVRPAQHLGTLTIGDQSTLTFYHTPGHANHHIGIHDERKKTFFAGDTLGVIYPSLERVGIKLVLPSTSPNQFDPELMLKSKELVKSLSPKRIAFGHFGVSHDPSMVYEQLTYWLPIFLQLGESFLEKNDFEGLKEALFTKVQKELLKFADDIPEEAYRSIEVDLFVSTMGILDYLSRQKRRK